MPLFLHTDGLHPQLHPTARPKLRPPRLRLANVRRLLGAVLCLLSGLLPLQAAAVDLQPGDIRTPPPGLKTVTTSLVSRSYDGAYRRGEKLPLDGEVRTDFFVVRAGASVEIADKPGFMYVQQSYGDLSAQGDFVRLAGGADSATGLLDTFFALALWPYTNRDTDTHFGIAAYLVTPSGEYRSERIKLNPGENRLRWALQTGFHQGLTEKLAVTAAFDTLWSGNNDDFGSRSSTYAQKPLYTLQGGLQYLIAPRTRLGAMLYHSFGGESSIDGIAANDRTELNRYQLTAYTDTAIGRFTLHYGGDLYAREGLKEKEHWIMRYTVFF